MAIKTKKVLLIEKEPGDVDVVRRFLALAGGGDFLLSVAVSIAEARLLVKSAPVDIILFDQNLQDGTEAQSLRSILDFAPHVPVVVLTGQGSHDLGAHLVRQGAQDYLIKGHFDAQLLVRVMKYALERAALVREVFDMKLREQYEREVKALDLLARQNTIASQSPAQLQSMAPGIFEKMEKGYAHLLDKAVEQRVYHIDGTPYIEGVRELAHDLMRVFAGPREVVKMHSAILEARLHSQKSELKAQVYLEEGRIVLLEILGGLVTAYRGVVSSREVAPLKG